MICNCNNTSENQSNAILPHVFGNVMRLAIPLTLRTVEGSNGEITTTDTDFIPSSNYPVVVEFSKGVVKINVDAVMRDGNVAYIEDKGTIPVGTYAITISCKDDNGNPYRFKQDAVLNVVDLTRQAGITPPAEYEVGTQYLDSAVYLALKGEDGVGVQDITIQTSGEVGGANRVTFILTDGREKSFDVLNGSGAVDRELNINSQSPIANKAVTEKFNQIDASLENVFGDVDYDSVSKSIRFYAKDKPKTSENILVSLDARPFIKDGMVNSVYISNNTLVITFNTDSGREAIGVPLTSVFNSNNYYNKTQIDNRFSSITSSLVSDYVAKVNLFARDNNVSTEYMPHFVLYAMGEPYDEGDDSSVLVHQPFFHNGYIMLSNAGMLTLTIGQPSTKVIYCNAKTNKLYRWDGSNFILVGGDEKVVFGGFISDSKFVVKKFDNSTSEWVNVRWAEHDPYSIYVDVITNKTYRFDENNGYVMIGGGSGGGSFEQVQADWNQSDSTSVDFIKNKPTIPTVPTNVSAFTNDAGYLTQHQDISGKVDKVAGKGLSTNDYTTAEKTKLAGLSNYDDTQIQAAIDALQAAIDALTGVNDTTEAINTMNEVIDFLNGVTNDETLTGKLNELRTLINGKVDKETGKSLMSEAEHTKLAGIAAGAEVNVQADWNQSSSSAKDFIKNKPTIPTKLSELEEDADHVTVTMQETVEWSSKQSQLVSGTNIKTINGQSVLGSGNLVIGDLVFGNYENGSFYLGSYVNGVWTFVSLPVVGDTKKVYIDVQNNVIYRWDGNAFVKLCDVDLTAYVPTTRTVNGKALSSNITLNASDVGAIDANTPVVKSVSVNGSNAVIPDANGKVELIVETGEGTVESVTINGTKKEPDINGDIDLGTVLTEHQSMKTVNGNTITGTGDVTIASTGAEVVQTTGTNTDKVMSQKAITESIINLPFEKIEHGTCVRFGPTDTRAYTQLNATQVAMLNNSDIMTIVFMARGFSANGDTDFRYIRFGPYGKDYFGFRSNAIGLLYLDKYAATGTSINSIMNVQNRHPVVYALVCNRVEGSVIMYTNDSLLCEHVSASDYVMNKFIDDNGTFMITSGECNSGIYAIQVYDFDVTPRIGGFLREGVSANVDGDWASTYGLSREFINCTSSGTAIAGTTKSKETAGSVYILYADPGIGYWYELTITVNVSFKTTSDLFAYVYDDQGIRLYRQNIKNIVFEEGTYTFKFSGQHEVYFALTTLEDNGTIAISVCRKRRCGCVANFKFDTLYDKNTIYDNVAKRYYTFYSNSSCTTKRTDLVSDNTILRTPVYVGGDLRIPHFVGEIKVYNGNVYIADNTYTWKKINNS